MLMLRLILSRDFGGIWARYFSQYLLLTSWYNSKNTEPKYRENPRFGVYKSGGFPPGISSVFPTYLLTTTTTSSTKQPLLPTALSPANAHATVELRGTLSVSCNLNIGDGITAPQRKSPHYHPVARPIYFTFNNQPYPCCSSRRYWMLMTGCWQRVIGIVS